MLTAYETHGREPRGTWWGERWEGRVLQCPCGHKVNDCSGHNFKMGSEGAGLWNFEWLLSDQSKVKDLLLCCWWLILKDKKLSTISIALLSIVRLLVVINLVFLIFNFSPVFFPVLLRFILQIFCIFSYQDQCHQHNRGN